MSLAHRYWRIRCPQTWKSGFMAAAEIELRETSGGADVTGSGTPGASSNFGGSFDITKSVDNNTGTSWTTGGVGAPSGGHYWYYDFGAGNEKEIHEISYTSRHDSVREDPLDLYVEYSDTKAFWYEKWSVLGIPAWAAAETRVYTDPYIGVTAAENQLDSFEARIVTEDGAPEARVELAKARVLYSYPAQEGRLESADARITWGGSGHVDARAEHLLARILIKLGADIRQLRAWTFTQDDHDFYGLQLGQYGTLILDKLSQQWAQWKSPTYAFWRVNDVVGWEGWNVACDTETGKLWYIDPTGRKDYDTTPIVSVVTSGYPNRMRTKTANYSAELCISEANPPSGIDGAAVGITLRTSDDEGKTFVNHGEVAGVDVGNETTVRWYGLGLIEAPGRLYELTDTGYARRIDGFNVEVEQENG